MTMPPLKEIGKKIMVWIAVILVLASVGAFGLWYFFTHILTSFKH